jgi:CDP-diacylglycerol--glycerol-3-phosphate 3-phosphatidyltransferase
MFYATEGAWVPELLAATVLVSSIVTSYAKARAELEIEHLPGGLLERGERIGLLAVGSLFGVMVPVLWLLALGTTVTAGQRIAAANRQMALVDAASPKQGLKQQEPTRG